MLSNIRKNSRSVVIIAQRFISPSSFMNASSKTVADNYKKSPDSFVEELKKGADTFGNYSDLRTKYELLKDDPEDIKEMSRMRKAERMSPPFYIHMVKSHLDLHAVSKSIRYIIVVVLLAALQISEQCRCCCG